MITTNGMAQYDHLSKEQKEQKSIELIDKAKYVVEGVVKDHECFYGEDGKTIYTGYTIEIAHWYKGTGENTIQLIKKGGVIDMDYQVNMHDPGPSFGVGPRYIFLLRESFKKGTFEFIGTEEAIAKYKYMSTDKSYLVGFYGLAFNSNEDVNTFFSKANKIKMLVKKKDVNFQKSSTSLPINITSINPAVIRAGTDEILTIRGTGFGAMAGNVLFRDADKPTSADGSDLYLLGLDDIYIVNWIEGVGGADDVIRVKVPSAILEGGPAWHGAGSGKIIIQAADGTLSNPSNQVLTVEYSLRNAGSFTIAGQSQLPMSPPFIAREHCLDGFVFTLHDSFSGEQVDKVNARASIEAALVNWRNALGITLELERKPGGGYQYVSFKDDPDNFRAIIRFEVLDSLIGMQTPSDNQWDHCDFTCYPAEYRYHGGGIEVNSTPLVPWHFSHLGNVPPQKSDFYAAILHEIGHYLGLGHNIALNADTTINNRNLMAHAPLLASSVAIPAAERVGLSNYNNRAVDAATNIVSASRMHLWTNDFKDKFGIETLAAAGNLSEVQPTPVIFGGLSFDPQPYSIKLLSATFDRRDNDYYWFPTGRIGRTQLAYVCHGTDYYVRAKDATCTVSSLYSLPAVFPLPGCSISDYRDGEGLIIYPNPTTGQLNIEFEETEEKSIDERETYIGIYDNLGRLQHQHSVSDATLRQTTIDISTLPAGMYWVVWFVGGEVIDTQQVQKTE